MAAFPNSEIRGLCRRQENHVENAVVSSKYLFAAVGVMRILSLSAGQAWARIC